MKRKRKYRLVSDGKHWNSERLWFGLFWITIGWLKYYATKELAIKKIDEYESQLTGSKKFSPVEYLERR